MTVLTHHCCSDRGTFGPGFSFRGRSTEAYHGAPVADYFRFEFPGPHDPSRLALCQKGLVVTLKRRGRPVGRMTDANFKPNTTLSECATGGFTLRWQGTCAGWLGQIRKGDRAQYVENLICHIGCSPPARLLAENKPKPPPAFTKTGKRSPPLCPRCFTFHAGECL
jgi:hypothetical protein